MLQKFERMYEGALAYNYYAMGGTMASGGADAGDSLRGLSTDFIAFDELQDMDASELPTIIEGMSHSKYKNQLCLGTPKLYSDALYTTWLASDMKEWEVTCPNCGAKHLMTFDLIKDDGSDSENVHYIYQCPDCLSEITDETRASGRWVQTGNPLAEYSGYHITQLIVPWITADEIMEKKNSVNYSTRRFFTEVLGLPYAGDDMPITEKMLDNCVKPYRRGDFTPNDRLYVGIDWGGKSYCSVINQKHELVDFYVEKDSDVDMHPKNILRWLFSRQYARQVVKMVCDAGPSIGSYYSLKKNAQTYKITCPIFACYFNSPPQSPEETWNEQTGVVRVGRSEIMEKLIEELQTNKFGFPQDIYDKDKEMIWKHFCNVASEMNSNSAGNEYLQFISLGADHLLFSTIYSVLASGGLQYTPIGGSYDTPIQNPNFVPNATRSEVQRKVESKGTFLRSTPSSNSCSVSASNTRRRSDTYGHNTRRRRGVFGG